MKKVIAITREDVSQYLDKAERLKSGAIKDHTLRILAVEIKNNLKLKLELAQVKRICEGLAGERQQFLEEIERLKKNAKKTHLRIIK